MTELLVAISSFVLSHFILSHPLRRPIVQRIGEQGFLGIYSLVAAVTLVWAVLAYRAAPSVQLWTAPAAALHGAYLVILIACILLAGSLLAPNPALVMSGGILAKSTDPQGVTGITRHPMMWAFGLWAIVHGIVNGRLETLILVGGIVVLALVGAWLQDGKKAAQLGPNWAAYASKTSYWPLGAQMTGRLPWRAAWPGGLPIIGGVILFAVLVFMHPFIIGKPVGLM